MRWDVYCLTLHYRRLPCQAEAKICSYPVDGLLFAQSTFRSFLRIQL